MHLVGLGHLAALCILDDAACRGEAVNQTPPRTGITQLGPRGARISPRALPGGGSVNVCDGQHCVPWRGPGANSPDAVPEICAASCSAGEAARWLAV